jgi:hypothetical protein
MLVAWHSTALYCTNQPPSATASETLLPFLPFLNSLAKNKTRNIKNGERQKGMVLWNAYDREQ